MQPRTDTDLLAFYGVTKPPVGSMWTWHTRDGHQITAVATPSPIARLRDPGGIPAVDSRRLVDHPANVGILADIFRRHVCATAYAVLSIDAAGESSPRWAVCDGNGRTTTPALTQFDAWHRALTHNAGVDDGDPWVAGRLLGSAVCSRASFLVSLRANICRDLGLDPDDESADIAEAIASLKQRAGAVRAITVPDDIDRDEAGYHTVDGVSLSDIIDARTHLARLVKFTVAEDFEHHWLSVAATAVQRACSAHGVETVSELSGQLIKANATTELQGASIEHLRAHHRGLDPMVMALAWEHDPAHAEELTHPIFRLVSLHLDAKHENSPAARFFAVVTPGTHANDSVVVGLNDDGSLWATLDTPTRLRAAEGEIIPLLIDGLSLHRGVQALLGVGDAETARGMIRVETTVPF